MAEDRTALLVLDYQRGLASQPWSHAALGHARSALSAAREHQLLVVFSKVGFERGYLDVSPCSRAFAPYRDDDMLPPAASLLIDGLTALDGEAVVNKNRFSPFAGSKLDSILRSQRITHVVLAGISTSGVVLGALTHGESTDLGMTVLADACADPNTELHDMSRSLDTPTFPNACN